MAKESPRLQAVPSQRHLALVRSTGAERAAELEETVGFLVELQLEAEELNWRSGVVEESGTAGVWR